MATDSPYMAPKLSGRSIHRTLAPSGVTEPRSIASHTPETISVRSEGKQALPGTTVGATDVNPLAFPDLLDDADTVNPRGPMKAFRAHHSAAATPGATHITATSSMHTALQPNATVMLPSSRAAASVALGAQRLVTPTKSFGGESVSALSVTRSAVASVTTSTVYAGTSPALSLVSAALSAQSDGRKTTDILDVRDRLHAIVDNYIPVARATQPTPLANVPMISPTASVASSPTECSIKTSPSLTQPLEIYASPPLPAQEQGLEPPTHGLPHLRAQVQSSGMKSTQCQLQQPHHLYASQTSTPAPSTHTHGPSLTDSVALDLTVPRVIADPVDPNSGSGSGSSQLFSLNDIVFSPQNMTGSSGPGLPVNSTLGRATGISSSYIPASSLGTVPLTALGSSVTHGTPQNSNLQSCNGYHGTSPVQTLTPAPEPMVVVAGPSLHHHSNISTTSPAHSTQSGVTSNHKPNLAGLGTSASISRPSLGSNALSLHSLRQAASITPTPATNLASDILGDEEDDEEDNDADVEAGGVFRRQITGQRRSLHLLMGASGVIPPVNASATPLGFRTSLAPTSQAAGTAVAAGLSSLPALVGSPGATHLQTSGSISTTASPTVAAQDAVPVMSTSIFAPVVQTGQPVSSHLAGAGLYSIHDPAISNTTLTTTTTTATPTAAATTPMTATIATAAAPISTTSLTSTFNQNLLAPLAHGPEYVPSAHIGSGSILSNTSATSLPDLL